MRKVHLDPEVRVEPSEGEIHPPVPSGFEIDAAVVLLGMSRPVRVGSALLPGGCQTPTPEGNRDRLWVVR